MKLIIRLIQVIVLFSIATFIGFTMANSWQSMTMFIKLYGCVLLSATVVFGVLLLAVIIMDRE